MKLALIVKNSLNGDKEMVEPAVRRTFYAIANEVDEQAEQHAQTIEALTARIEQATIEFTTEVKSVRRLLIGVASTVIAGVIVGIINVAVTF